MKIRLFAILLAAVVLTGCGRSEKKENNNTPLTSTEIQSETADTSGSTESTEPYIVTFEAETTDGTAISSDCFADSKLTMINVWATYCNPCLSEMPDLGEIAVSYDKEDFQIIGIVSDVMEFSEEAAKKEALDLIEQTGAGTYPHIFLNQSLYSSLVGTIDGVPTTFFVNQKGELLGYLVGAQTKEAWEELINDLLAQENQTN